MTKLFPGMLNDGSVEYFNHQQDVMCISRGRVRRFEEIKEHYALSQTLDAEPATEEILSRWYNGNRRAMLKKFASCRFGGLDKTADLCSQTSRHDFVECPLRGKCEGEGIICRLPVVNGAPVNFLEISILRLLATDRKNSAIAADLNIPLGTLNAKKTKLYNQFAIKTKPQLSLLLSEMGLL